MAANEKAVAVAKAKTVAVVAAKEKVVKSSLKGKEKLLGNTNSSIMSISTGSTMLLQPLPLLRLQLQRPQSHLLFPKRLPTP